MSDQTEVLQPAKMFSFSALLSSDISSTTGEKLPLPITFILGLAMTMINSLLPLSICFPQSMTGSLNFRWPPGKAGRKSSVRTILVRTIQQQGWK
jgi:hypothetical protein